MPLRKIAAACILLVLWGCQTTPAPKEPAPPPKQAAVPVVPVVPERSAEEREREQVSMLIAYFQGIANMTPDEQRRELATVAQASARDRTLYSRLRLALLLTAPGTSFADDARAASLIEPAMPGIGPISGTSPQQSASQSGALGGTAGPGNPLRQFAGMLHTLISERLREQRRAVQLKEQLDALRAVERSLIERGQRRR